MCAEFALYQHRGICQSVGGFRKVFVFMRIKMIQINHLKKKKRVRSNVANVWKDFSVINRWAAKTRPECVRTERDAMPTQNANDQPEVANTAARLPFFNHLIQLFWSYQCECSIQCKIGYAGSGKVCGPDRDLDGWPDYDLSCTDDKCRKVLTLI